MTKDNARLGSWYDEVGESFGVGKVACRKHVHVITDTGILFTVGSICGVVYFAEFKDAAHWVFKG